MKHPVLFILVVGLIIRLLIATLIVQYDADYWARVIRNLRVDEGLYNMEGFYYTPVWGYVLSFIGLLQHMFLDLGEYGVRVTEAIFTEYVPNFYLSANITSLAFNYSVRIPLIICDALLSLAVYWLIKDMTGDNRKSLMALMLTFISAHLAGCTCMTGMPDTITALFMVLTIIFMRRDSNLLAGCMFALSALTKFFPVFLFFILCAYILKKHKGDLEKTTRELGMAIIGATVTTLVIYLPVIMEGRLIESFAFIMDRSSGIGSVLTDHWAILVIGGIAVLALLGVIMLTRVRRGGHAICLRNLWILTLMLPVLGFVGGIAIGGLDSIVGSSRIALYVAAIMFSMALGISMYRSRGPDLDHSLVWCCTLVIGFCMLYPPAPQYVVTLVPLLACYIAISGRGIPAWIVLFIAGVFFIPISNGLLLMNLAEWTDMISVETAMGIFRTYQIQIGGITLMDLQYIISGGLQYIGLLMVVLTLLKDGRHSKDLLSGIPKTGNGSRRMRS